MFVDPEMLHGRYARGEDDVAAWDANRTSAVNAALGEIVVSKKLAERASILESYGKRLSLDLDLVRWVDTSLAMDKELADLESTETAV